MWFTSLFNNQRKLRDYAWTSGWTSTVVVSEDEMAQLLVALNGICAAWISTLYQLDFRGDEKVDKKSLEFRSCFVCWKWAYSSRCETQNSFLICVSFFIWTLFKLFSLFLKANMTFASSTNFLSCGEWPTHVSLVIEKFGFYQTLQLYQQ